MRLAIVVDTEGNEGTAYQLDPQETLPDEAGCLNVVDKVGEFPFSGALLASMMGISTP